MPSAFPKLTLCNINPIANKHTYDFVHDSFKMKNRLDLNTNKTDMYSLRYFVTFILNQPNISVEEKKRFGPRFNETVLLCVFNTVHCNESDFDWFFSGYYGSCFQFNTNRNMFGDMIAYKNVTRSKFLLHN
jgi:hypothetical protein